MEVIEEKNVKKVDNSNYREKFQFVVRVNDNIICQRYFKIARFNNECLQSKELFDVLDGYRGPKQEMHEYYGDNLGVVQLIQRDLESKSRIYTLATSDCKTKLTGFTPDSETTYVEWEPKPWDDTEFIKPWDVVFKFTFLVDEKVVYEKIWDASQYPKYVRNSVDLTNSRSQYPLVQLMNSGKQDLVVEIIKRICNVASNPEEGEPRTYTKSDVYTNDEQFVESSKNSDTYKLWYNDGNGNLVSVECQNDEKLSNQISNNIKKSDGKSHKYYYTPYNKDYVNKWRNYCFKKYGPIIAK